MLINIFSRSAALRLPSSRMEGANALHRTARINRRLTSCELTQKVFKSTGSLETGKKGKDDLILKQIQETVQKLKVLFGEDLSTDFEYMLEREPRLLTADMNIIARRLMDLRVSHAFQATDLLPVVEAEPSILFTEPSVFSKGGSYYWEDRWDHALASYREDLWNWRLDDLRAYISRHGDAHVGFRETDNPLLVQWAAEQRKEGYSNWSRSDTPERLDTLSALDFEFDVDEAEWLCRYNELDPWYALNLPGAPKLDLKKWCDFFPLFS
ncbi:hypothetical protein WJX75_009445 [Coccomyxa subellipsoidea]|uniref:Helicase-associated domain-containing protein n=1 Tax=Coccomyxa subellipsoidea TaxID=248742 RepID=A0ABR2YH13_9CHLO